MAASAEPVLRLRRVQWKYLLLLVGRQMLHADGKFDAAIIMTEKIRLTEEAMIEREMRSELLSFLNDRAENTAEYYD